MHIPYEKIKLPRYYTGSYERNIYHHPTNSNALKKYFVNYTCSTPPISSGAGGTRYQEVFQGNGKASHGVDCKHRREDQGRGLRRSRATRFQWRISEGEHLRITSRSSLSRPVFKRRELVRCLSVLVDEGQKQVWESSLFHVKYARPSQCQFASMGPCSLHKNLWCLHTGGLKSASV